MLPKNLGKSSEKIYIRRGSGKHALDFKISKVTPAYLQEVFQLEAMPKFLFSEKNGTVIEIDESEMKPNEIYSISGLDVENRMSLPIDYTRDQGK